jgi:hypothetical protein
MKPLSEQLSDLADRAKQAEDTVAAAQAKNRAALQSQREKLKSSIDAATRRTQADATAAHEEMQSWWDETRSDIHDRFEELRAKRDERCAERDLQRAENRADDAELDAADAIDFAAYTIDEAEYAVVDAGIARADADELKVEQSSDAATALWVSSSPPELHAPRAGAYRPRAVQLKRRRRSRATGSLPSAPSCRKQFPRPPVQGQVGAAPREDCVDRRPRQRDG